MFWRWFSLRCALLQKRMAATVTKAISAMESQPPPKKHNAAQVVDVEFVTCECCGLKEECTPPYIARVKERYQGRWICGLCSEAVKEESLRGISTDEAVKSHMNFCEQFRSSSNPKDPTDNLISAMKQLLRRSLHSPTKEGGSGRQPLSRTKSCFS